MTAPAMTQGTLFLVVGPSGAGKDSLIEGLRARVDGQRFEFARRIITRPEDAGGEAHEASTLAAFDEREAAGEFLISWRAHGLAYGLSRRIADSLAAGRHVVANGSRGAIARLAARVPTLAVVEIDAPAAVLAARLAARGRETVEDVARRLERAGLRSDYPAGVPVLRVVNDCRLDIGVARLEAAIGHHLGLPMNGTPPAVTAKIAGRRLAPEHIDDALSAIVERRLGEAERDAFLIACANDLDEEELLGVARWRTRLMPRVQWDASIVVDKHSLGGTAGSRVTMVVIPIVAAHGLTIPKTSSRAITSAAGTADAMEVLARVDLNPQELRRCVEKTGACIAWNGKLNHSALDEAMHAIERPLALDTRRWSVASILSKKYSAGATHVVIDIPFAPHAKVRDIDSARELAGLFESVGVAMGLTVRAFPTDASAPIGRGIGPALEARDVIDVLNNHPDAPSDLRQKSLFFASRIIALDPALGADLMAAERRALQLLEDGSALRAMEAIIAAQGPHEAADAANLQEALIPAPQSGAITGIRARTINAIARMAGAPSDALAGVDLLRRPGEEVRAGEVLYRIQARDPRALERARATASEDCGFDWQYRQAPGSRMTLSARPPVDGPR
jgi:thymidine phosphorylase